MGNDELKRITAYFVMRPEFLALQYGLGDIEVLAKRHSYAKYCYFYSKACKSQTMPVEARSDTQCIGYASGSDEDIQKSMGAAYHWVQVEGMDTPDVTKHMYQRRPGPSDACGT